MIKGYLYVFVLVFMIVGGLITAGVYYIPKAMEQDTQAKTKRLNQEHTKQLLEKDPNVKKECP